MGPKREALSAGLGAAIAGLGLLLAAPSSEPLTFVLSSSLGATGGSLLVNRKKIEIPTQEQGNGDISDSLEKIKNLLAINTEEITALKQKLGEVSLSQPKSSDTGKTANKPAKNSVAQPHPVNYESQYKVDSNPVARTATASPKKPHDQQITNWFKKHKAILLTCKDGQQNNVALQQAALLIGENYPRIKSIIEKLKTNQAKEKDIEINLQEFNEDSLAAIETVFKFLDQHKIVTSQLNRDAQQLLLHKVAKDETINFFSSQWLKLYLYQHICELLNQKSISYSAVWDITGIQADKNFQMDLFFLVEGRPFWVACKTTKNYTQPVKRHLNLIERLKFPLEQQMMVLSEYDEAKVWDEELQPVIEQLSLTGIDQCLAMVEKKLSLTSRTSQQLLVTSAIAADPVQSSSQAALQSQEEQLFDLIANQKLTLRAATNILLGEFSPMLKQTLLRAVEAGSFNFNSWSLFHTLTQVSREPAEISFEITGSGQWKCQVLWGGQMIIHTDPSKDQARNVAVLQRMQQLVAD